VAETRQDLRFYRQQSQTSFPGRYEALCADLPTDVGELFENHPRLRMPAGYQPHYFELPFFKVEADNA
jgi:hypothetical protein